MYNYLKLTRVTDNASTDVCYINPDNISAFQEVTHPWTGQNNRVTQLYFLGFPSMGTGSRNEGFYVRESVGQILEQLTPLNQTRRV